MQTNRPRKIVYFSSGMGAGGIYRALSLYRAFRKLEQDAGYAPGSLYQFIPVVLSDYAPLFSCWNIPAITGPVFDNQVDRGDFLRDALARLRGCDAIIASYHVAAVQKALQELPGTIKPPQHNYLILRQFPSMTEFLIQHNFQAGRWSRVFGIEPEVADQVRAFVEQTETSAKPDLVAEVGPTLSIWPEELLTREEARRELVEQAGLEADVIENGKPLMLVCHNGTGAEEVSRIEEWACLVWENELKTTGKDYQIVTYSQTGLEGAAFDPYPIARYFQGVDHLVAVPGYTTFWEWLSYSRPEAKSSWLPFARTQEDSARRIPLMAEYRDWLRGNRNGAEEIARMVMEDLTEV